MLRKVLHNGPQVHATAFIMPGAIIIGQVEIAEDVFVASIASIRADEGKPFYIGNGTNVQGFVQLHGLKDQYFMEGKESYSIYIGRRCSLAHGCIVHGPAKLGDDVFVGFQSLVAFSKVGDRCVIGHGARVTNVTIPPNRYVPDGLTVNERRIVDCLGEVPANQAEFRDEVYRTNVQLRQEYQQGKHVIWFSSPHYLF